MHALFHFASSYYFQGDDGNWSWLDGTPWDTTFWASGEPEYNRYTCILSSSGSWNTADCEDWKPFYVICQK